MQYPGHKTDVIEKNYSNNGVSKSKRTVNNVLDFHEQTQNNI